MKTHIRRVEDRDYEDIAAIYSYASVIEQTSQLPHENAAFWQGFYSSKAPRCIELVAVCDNKAVSHLGILLNTDPRRKHLGSFGIAVHPDYQGKGIGKAMLNELIRLSDNWLNLVKIELHVFSDNEKAVALYKQFGFVIEGESRYDLFKQGKYCHSYQMARIHPNFTETT